ncbi:MAG: hypothetical protein HY867_08600 [Chloroflexi bacterium]|nr:hypothetical protein [Chloroflexota bacterium]
MAKKNKSDQDSVGRDRIVSGGAGSVVIGGNATNNTIIAGDNNRVNASSKFKEIYQQVDERRDLTGNDKTDLKSELQAFESDDKKGPEANEGFLAQRLRNVKRIAPDILEVATATILNPVAGFGVIAKKVAEKMKAEAK